MLGVLVWGIAVAPRGDRGAVWTQETTMASTNITTAQSRDERRREWDKLCTEVGRARDRLKRIDRQVTWLIAYIRGLPPDPPTDPQGCLYVE